jgi:hypothetical protein
MLYKPLKPRKALNKAFLKVKPNRSDIELFKANLIALVEQMSETPLLSQEIDWLVYGLYGLTEEEIGIVENSNR